MIRSGAESFAPRTAIIDERGGHPYREILDASGRIASVLLDGGDDLREARVAFMADPGADYPATQWAIWRAGGVAVPLCTAHPAPELRYVLEDADGATVVAHRSFESLLRPLAEALGRRFLLIEDALTHAACKLPNIEASHRAMILYTSGTTSKPKGVVTTHANINAQVASLVEAWEWSADDRVLHVLPLHHIHGIINVLSCALSCGATCEMLPRFAPAQVWDRLASGEVTLFMAVPTIYSKLIDHWESAPPDVRERWSRGAARLRLMVSGSAALPVPVLEKWRAITGHTLLERYGMTEIGMALSNPYRPAEARTPGSVGVPLPGVEVRLVDEHDHAVADGQPGEIQVRGPTVFHEYWQRPDATRDSFRDGWFRTGDTAVIEHGRYRILGRSSIDIIKTGGYKVSALEIEDVLLAHPAIAQCAVLGVPDREWGERVCAAIVLRARLTLTLDELRAWAKERLATYKVPKDARFVDALPRNAMGKVTKPALRTLF